jgi:CelD/BcsL family acetyltransferase involved in cellulose biosynthesis/SAM-dependent methyltransferase
MVASDVYTVNKAYYDSPGVPETYARRKFLFAPERTILDRLAGTLKDGAILAIGIGPGRTVPYTSALTPRYVGIDYSPNMLELARRDFPHLALLYADARRLCFADGSFDTVFICWNAIDDVAHDERLTILGEVRRVLKQGGYFAFSAHNLGAPRKSAYAFRGFASSLSLLAAMRENLARVRRYVRDIVNHHRYRARGPRGALQHYQRPGLRLPAAHLLHHQGEPGPPARGGRLRSYRDPQPGGGLHLPFRPLRRRLGLLCCPEGGGPRMSGEIAVPRSAVARAIDGAGLTFEVLHDVASVAAASTEWAGLLSRSSCNRAFSSAAWFGAWYEVFDDFAPYVLVGRRAGGVAGLLPLAVAPGGDAVLSPCNWSDYNDAIIDGDDARVAAGLLARAISELTADCRVVLRRIRHDSCLGRALPLLLGGDPLAEGFGAAPTSQYIDLSGGIEPYLRGRSQAFRKGLAKTKRRAREAGIVVRELSPRSDPADELAAAFLAVHLPRFGEASCFYADQARRFLARMLPTLYAEGNVRAFGVFAGGRLAALDLCVTGPTGLCLWNGGFITDVATYSPGTLLLDHEIRQVASEGLEELDLLRGQQAWKGRWSTGCRRLGQVVLGRTSQSRAERLGPA